MQDAQHPGVSQDTSQAPRAVAVLAIGAAYKRSRETSVVALGLGLLIVAAHLSLSGHDGGWSVSARVPLCWFTVLSFGALARWDWRSLGLRVSPVQGWRYWIKATLLIGLVALVLTLGASVIFHLMGYDVALSPAKRDIGFILNWLVRGCLEAPLYEETVYRLALCAGLVALAGRRATIALSGLVFAWLHFVYGNPSPDNFVAGYVLAWAYLHSGSLAVPVLLHALGNLTVLVALLIV